MELTREAREHIESWRRAAYILAKSMDAGLHRIQASEGELNVIRGAALEMRELVTWLADILESENLRYMMAEEGQDIKHLALQFLQHVPFGVIRDVRHIAGFLDSLGQNGPTQDEGEEKTRTFMREFHEFLYREVLRGVLPEPRATSLTPAHG